MTWAMVLFRRPSLVSGNADRKFETSLNVNTSIGYFDPILVA
mgnify:CR=1 FL=1